MGSVNHEVIVWQLHMFFVFLPQHDIILCTLWCANDRLHCGLEVVFFCLHIEPSRHHHYGNSPEGIGYINACRVHYVE